MTAECLHPYGGQPAERQPVFSCNVPLSLAAGLLDSLVFLRARSCSMHVAVVTSFVARAQCSHSCTALWSLATSSLSKGWQKRQGASANDWYGSKHTHTLHESSFYAHTFATVHAHRCLCWQSWYSLWSLCTSSFSTDWQWQQGASADGYSSARG